MSLGKPAASPASSQPAPHLFVEPDSYRQLFYQLNKRKYVIGILISIATFGIWPILCYFRRIWWINFTYEQCEPAVASVVIFQREESQETSIYNVQYFSSDGLNLQPVENSLKASEFISSRIEVGDGWWLFYDEKSSKFIKSEGPSSSNQGNSFLDSIHKSFSHIYESVDPYENRRIADQLEFGLNWLNKGKEDEHELVGYREIRFFTFLLYLEYFLSGGIFWLFCYWMPYLKLYLTHCQCNLLAADVVLAMVPANKSKKEKPAALIFPPWLITMFYYGFIHAFLLILPIGFIVMLLLMIALHILLRPNAVRHVKHAARDGQQVSVRAMPKARRIGYFRSMACSEASVIKYFTWQKVKYVWSGTVKLESSGKIVTSNCFERQLGLIAQDEAETDMETAKAKSIHQVLGILPTLSFFHSRKGLSKQESRLISGLIGKNAMELPLTPLIVVFFREILSPFYIFQIFSVTVWATDEYLLYAIVIIVLSAVSMIWQMVEIRMREVGLRRTMHKPDQVEVVRPDEYEVSTLVDPEHLVPGDVVIIPKSGCTLQCDVCLITGTCLVDEAMLTGESVPVLKFGLPPVNGHDEILHIRKHERSILFCGTRVLQGNCNGPIKAVVVRTGFMTAKGELTRLILYPKPLDFEFTVDAVKFVGVMAAVAMLGLCYSIAIRVARNEEPKVIVLRSLDIITIAVPPALPIALTIGYLMAQRRLQQRKLYCTSPSAINLAGVVDVVCMDKTGTMTEGGLDFEELLAVKSGRSSKSVSPGSLGDGDLLRCLVTCHSLALVNGKAIGDPMEEKMFEMANWRLKEPDHSLETKFPPIITVEPPTRLSGAELSPLSIIRQLPFSSHFQRMSVVATNVAREESEIAVYLKGAPEVVVSLCRPETVPVNLESTLETLTENGYRVLGLACRSLAGFNENRILSCERAELEQQLTFLGLLVFENKLKPETVGVIKKLKFANIRTLMLTGDNPLTAVSVARQAGIIEPDDRVLLLDASINKSSEAVMEFIEIKKPLNSNSPSESGNRLPSYILDVLPSKQVSNIKLVLTGSSWAVVKEHFPHEIDRILLRGAVFARVNPNHKKEVVEGLQRLGLHALMCGDGANDCGALRAACAGISLSQAEASVASPFTSKIDNISCIHLLIREGRCALVTSFAIFRFMVLYALIQFISTLILYYFRASLGEYGFLYADLFLTTTLVFTMSFTQAYQHLVSEKPAASLLDARPLLSILFQAFLIVLFQSISLIYLTNGGHNWFLPFVPPEKDTETYYCFEYYAVFIISAFQYPCTSLVLSKGVPFRKPVFSNWLYCLNLAIILAANIYICFFADLYFGNNTLRSIANLFTFPMPPSIDYRAAVFLLSAIYCLVSLLAETIIVERKWVGDMVEKCLSFICNTKPKKKKYEILEEQMNLEGEKWPSSSRVSQTLHSQAEKSHDKAAAGYDNKGLEVADEEGEEFFHVNL